MPADQILDRLAEQAARLSPQERLQLIERIARGPAENADETPPTESGGWMSLRGIAPDLLKGEDAQEWVSRLRDEWEEREIKLERDS